MNCEQYPSGMFYLAEDDPRTRETLQEHLDACSDCRMLWEEYRVVLEAYDSVLAEGSPALAVRTQPRYVWSLLRIAVVLLFAGLLGLLWQQQTGKQQVSVRQDQNAIMPWEPPSVQFLSTPLDTKDQDFQERIHYIEDAIARLQVKSSTDQF